MAMKDQPAFPVTPANIGWQTKGGSCGMTLLQHYAGKQMAAIRADYGFSGESKKLAKKAVEDAMALIAELEKIV